MTARLLAGPPLDAGAETLSEHHRRLGPLPPAAVRRRLPETLEASGLLGRGGAAFPVGRKWASVAGRADGSAVVLVNGAEGEPLSVKDRSLIASRPHLVLDGAQLAADAIGADRIVLYIGSEHTAARDGLERALLERASSQPFAPTVPVDLVAAPTRYVAGEETAAVHFVNDGDARPTTVPPRPFERGIGGRPTLVQNVESLAYAALIARFGDQWYRESGVGLTRGTALVTVHSVERPGLREIELGMPLAELARAAGATRGSEAVLLGGYFGGWLAIDEARDLRLDPLAMRAAGTGFGCGVVGFLEPGRCGVRLTARILDFMAGQSAAQCGPCVLGLRAIADATARIASGIPRGDELERLTRWSAQVAGRGACRHPDGAVGLLLSALRVFEDEFIAHATGRGCHAETAKVRAA